MLAGIPGASGRRASSRARLVFHSDNGRLDVDNELLESVPQLRLDDPGIARSRANRVVEISANRTTIERVARRFGLQPRRLEGDTAYGTVGLLKWLVDRQITPHIPAWD